MDGGVAIKDVLVPNLRLVHYRQAASLSQQELAMICGVSRATIGLIERINYQPGYDKKRKIARALRLKVHDLWPDEEDD